MKRLPPDPFPTRDGDDPDAIDTAAAAWLIEREEGFSPDRAACLAAWRASDTRHEVAFIRTARALDLIGEMPAIGTPLAARIAEETRVVRPVFFRAPVWASALAAALALAAAVAWFAPTRADAVVQRYATAPTRQQEIALNDGSVLNLNVGSEVRVEITSAARRVTLDAGEAHFAVAHDPARPFIVTAAGVSVRAVGTAFGVRLGENGVEVLVTEGKVQVERVDPNVLSPDSAAGDPARRGQRVPRESTLLSANERMVVVAASSAPPVIEPAAPAAIREALAWHARTTTFSDVPLREIVARFNRRNIIQLTLGDDELGARTLGGTFALDQADAFARLLAQDGDIAMERRGENEIVLRRTR